MSTFYSRSIRRKLMLLCTVTASLTVLIACSSLWIYQLLNYRTTLQADGNATAQLIAESSSPALLFDDSIAATETLSLLRADTRIKLACLYNKQGRVFAKFAPAGSTQPCPAVAATSSTYTNHKLSIAKVIEAKGEPVGMLYLEVGLSEMYRLLVRLAETGFCVLLIATIFALALSSLLERLISGPILHLTAVATKVSLGNNYLARAKRISDDEIGVLIDRFNFMMDHLQQREEDLRHAHDGLEAKVEERTTDLRNEIIERKIIERDLGVAKLLAEESNKAKSAFVANMSHELRTPLNAIIGYSEMLYEDAEISGSVTMSDDLQKVLLSARHLLALISDILDFSKIEAGEMKVYPELVSSCEVLDTILPTAEVLAVVNRNRIVMTSPSWHGDVLIDPLRFRQCLLNLIGNACKFTEDGTITISVEQQNEDGRRWIQWSVRDTGAGISVEEQGKLFQTFSQGDSSATRRHGGSGLGLAISQQLCNAMGGYIRAVSQVGKGSSFTISIPDEPGAYPNSAYGG
jgi:signal transduction histidine kinase